MILRFLMGAGLSRLIVPAFRSRQDYIKKTLQQLGLKCRCLHLNRYIGSAHVNKHDFGYVCFHRRTTTRTDGGISTDRVL